MPRSGAGEWRYGFCECCSSPSDCLLGYCCPCVYAGMASSNIGEGTLMSALQCLCYPLLVPVIRNKVRKQRGIQGSLVGDLLIGCCFPCCTMIQTRREVVD